MVLVVVRQLAFLALAVLACSYPSICQKMMLPSNVMDAFIYEDGGGYDCLFAQRGPVYVGYLHSELTATGSAMRRYERTDILDSHDVYLAYDRESGNVAAFPYDGKGVLQGLKVFSIYNGEVLAEYPWDEAKNRVLVGTGSTIGRLVDQDDGVVYQVYDMQNLQWDDVVGFSGEGSAADTAFLIDDKLLVVRTGDFFLYSTESKSLLNSGSLPPDMLVRVDRRDIIVDRGTVSLVYSTVPIGNKLHAFSLLDGASTTTSLSYADEVRVDGIWHVDLLNQQYLCRVDAKGGLVLYDAVRQEVVGHWYTASQGWWVRDVLNSRGFVVGTEESVSLVAGVPTRVKDVGFVGEAYYVGLVSSRNQVFYAGRYLDILYNYKDQRVDYVAGSVFSRSLEPDGQFVYFTRSGGEAGERYDLCVAPDDALFTRDSIVSFERSGRLEEIAVSVDKTRMIAAMQDKIVSVDCSTGELICSSVSPEGNDIVDAVISRNGEFAVVITEEFGLLFDMNSGCVIDTIREITQPFNGGTEWARTSFVETSDGRKYVLSRPGQYQVGVYEVTTQTMKKYSFGTKLGVHTTRNDIDGTRAVSCLWDGTIVHWDITDGSIIKRDSTWLGLREFSFDYHFPTQTLAIVVDYGIEVRQDIVASVPGEITDRLRSSTADERCPLIFDLRGPIATVQARDGVGILSSSLYNMSGQSVPVDIAVSSPEAATFDLSSLSAGAYILVVQADDNGQEVFVTEVVLR